MALSDRDRVRYARQLLLPQLGESGQERLLATRLRPARGADAGALETARTYLTRAGVSVVDEPSAADHPVGELALASTAEVERIASDGELREAARALLGALAAVDAIFSAALGGARPVSAIPAIGSEEA